MGLLLITPNQSGAATTLADLPIYIPQPGDFISLPYSFASTNSQLQLAADTAYWFPLVIKSAATIVQLAVGTNTGGSAGSVVRLGIRSDASSKPGVLLLDAGTVASTGSFASLTKTISQLLAAGNYWVGLAGQGSPVTQPQIKGVNGTATIGTVPSATTGDAQTPKAYVGYTEAAVGGAFASNPGVLTRFEIDTSGTSGPTVVAGF